MSRADLVELKRDSPKQRNSVKGKIQDYAKNFTILR